MNKKSIISACHVALTTTLVVMTGILLLGKSTTTDADVCRKELKKVKTANVLTRKLASKNYDKNLENIKIENAKIIDAFAFRGHKELKNVEMDEVTEISEWAFDDCESLETVIAPNLETVDWMAFGNCKMLSTINAKKLKIISMDAFLGCESLETIIAPNLEKVDSTAFDGCGGVTIYTNEPGRFKDINIKNVTFKDISKAPEQ